eukprot:gene13595-16621_t
MWSGLATLARQRKPAAWHGPCPSRVSDPPPEPAMMDPIRLAFRPPGSLSVPSPADGGPELGPDEAIPIPGEMSFDDVLNGLNPLHHVPGVGMIYR